MANPRDFMIRNAKIGSKKHSIQVRFFSYILAIQNALTRSKYSASFPIFDFVYFACQVFFLEMIAPKYGIFRIGKEMTMFTNLTKIVSCTNFTGI